MGKRHHKTPAQRNVKKNKPNIKQAVKALKIDRHSNIPKTVVKLEKDEITGKMCNPLINSAGNGPLMKANKAYQELRDARKKELRKHSRTPTGHIRLKTPWYMLTKGKVYKCEDTTWLKVESESTRLHNKTVLKKFTRDDLTIGYLDARMEDWKKLHPEPQTDDLFYKEEHPKWVSDYEEHHDKVVKMLVDSHITKYNKKTINAVLESRYRLNQAA